MTVDPRLLRNVQMVAADIESNITENVIDQAVDISKTKLAGKTNAEVTAIIFILLVGQLQQVPIELREAAGIAITGLLKAHIAKADEEEEVKNRGGGKG